jgi:hypothetical protein
MMPSEPLSGQSIGGWASPISRKIELKILGLGAGGGGLFINPSSNTQGSSYCPKQWTGKEPLQEPKTLCFPSLISHSGQSPGRAGASGLQLQWPRCSGRNRPRDNMQNRWGVDKRGAPETERAQAEAETDRRLLWDINRESWWGRESHPRNEVEL